MLLLLGACAEQTPVAPDVGSPSFNQQTGTLLVRVFNSNGTPATDGTIVVEGASGPVRKPVVGGEASFVVPAGNAFRYCAYAMPAHIDAATTLIAPPPDGAAPAYGGATGQASVVTGPSLQSLGLTAGTYRSNCLQSRPIRVMPSGATVNLTFQPAHQLQVNLLDLDGAALPGLGVWTIGTGLTRDEIPWANFSGVPADILPGLLYSVHVTASPAPGFAPANADIVLEVLKDLPPSKGRKQGYLTVTRFMKAGGAGQTSELALQLEPFACEAVQHNEGYGDATGPVDLGPVKYGFRANPDLTPDLSGAVISWEQKGFGQATLNQRLVVGGAVRQLNVTYTCGPDGCIVNSVWGSALSGGVEAALFFAPLGAGGSFSTVRVTLLESGLPTNVTAKTFTIKTNGDELPNASKSDASSSQLAFAFPGSPCAYTNDDRWAMAPDLF